MPRRGISVASSAGPSNAHSWNLLDGLGMTHMCRCDIHTFLGEEELIDDNVMRVNLVGCQFLYEALGLVQGQELRNAHANEGGFFLLNDPIHQCLFWC